MGKHVHSKLGKKRRVHIASAPVFTPPINVSLHTHKRRGKQERQRVKVEAAIRLAIIQVNKTEDVPQRLVYVGAKRYRVVPLKSDIHSPSGVAYLQSKGARGGASPRNPTTKFDKPLSSSERAERRKTGKPILG